MKNLFLLFALLLLACGSAPSNSTSATSSKSTTEAELKSDRVEVLYFYGKQRCATCQAIEQGAIEALKANFAEELKSGAVVFKIVDISTSEGEELAKKYKVSWSSLYANKWQGGAESVNNLTKMGFSYARTQPDKFKSEFTAEITKLLE